MIIMHLASSLMSLTFEEDLWRKYLDRLCGIAQMIGGGVVQHRLWVSLQNGVLLGCLLPHQILGLE